MKFWLMIAVFAAVLGYGYTQGWFDQLLGLSPEQIGDAMDRVEPGVLDGLVNAVRDFGKGW